MQNKFIPVLLAVLSSGCALDLLDNHGDNCNAEDTTLETLDASGLEKVSINTGQGFLRITGDTTTTTLTVEGRTCASHARYLDDTELRVSQQDKELFIDAILPDNAETKMDVTVTMPAGLWLEVTDGSGDVLIEYVQGDIYLRDNSGDIRSEHVTGNITLNDGSGNILVLDAIGDVTIENDGSGSIELRQIDGNVSIGSDGSGDISGRDISGDFFLGRDGSGAVNLWNIQG
jgi:hypothetical protein